jgi:hypothetical protein
LTPRRGGKEDDGMGESRAAPGPAAEARARLARYGLDDLLTAQDDPVFWAAAVAQHWPPPESADLHPAELRFGLGRLPAGGAGEAVASTRSGLEVDEEWCFERVDAERLRAVPCQEHPQPSFLFAVAMASSGEGAALNDPAIYQGRLYLDLSRPSRGQARALVHAGTSALGTAGRGETHVWAVDEEGRWEDTGEVVARWLT